MSQFCPTMIRGMQDVIPIRKRKFEYEDVREAIILIKRRNKILMRKCAQEERWAGLWDFPRASLDSSSSLGAIQDSILHSTGLKIIARELGRTIKHGVTKYRIQLDCFESMETSGRLKSKTNFCWKSPKEIADLPLSSTGRKFADLYAAS